MHWPIAIRTVASASTMTATLTWMTFFPRLKAIPTLKMKRTTRTRITPTPNNLSRGGRSEEHTSELQSLMRISYAVFCLKKKTTVQKLQQHQQTHQHVSSNTYRVGQDY